MLLDLMPAANRSTMLLLRGSLFSTGVMGSRGSQRFRAFQNAKHILLPLTRDPETPLPMPHSITSLLRRRALPKDLEPNTLDNYDSQMSLILRLWKSFFLYTLLILSSTIRYHIYQANHRLS
jgi:hypothetical protein